jgi:enamine deaminase RidA (YjgF/YER057c/UK114 family)
MTASTGVGRAEQRLRELGIDLPPPPRPAGSYRPWVRHGDVLWLAGQLPVADGELRYRGRVGAERTEAEGIAAARLAGCNVLSQLRGALGDLDRVLAVLRVDGHVASAPGWTSVPTVLDGASELLVHVLGDRGRHARSAFAPERLPLDATVELVVTVAVSPG